MAAAADIGAGFSDYQGNAGLGGGNFGVISVDTKPLDNLSLYTFTYNRAQYEQRQKDAEAKAAELAKVTAYDLSTAIPGDREKIQEGYDKLYKFVQDNPNVLDYKKNPNGWLKYNKMKNSFENDLNGGKTRSLLYTERQKEVTDATDPEMKAYLQKTLDEEANSTGLRTPLKHTQLYEIAPVTAEAPSNFKIDVSRKGQNFLATRTWELPDMSSIVQQASSKVLGIEKDNLDEAELAGKTPEEQALIRSRFKAQQASGRREPVESANNISSVLQNEKYKQPQFRNADGTLNIDAVKKDNAGNALVAGVLSSIEQYNSKMDEMTNQIKAGYFTDNTGKDLTFGQGALKENDYRKIDLSDGLSAQELMQVRIMGLAKTPSYTTKYDQSNEQISRGQLGVAQQNAQTAVGHLNETIRHDKATEQFDKDQLQSQTDKWKASVKGTETQVNGALERAKRIYGDLQKLADKNGVINPDQLRKLNVEQLKYLGIEVPEERDESGAITLKGGFRPLAFDKKTEYAIQLIGGQIRVLSGENNKGGKLDRFGENGFAGQYDPTKSTTLANIGTNILNEELKTAGTKELNAYTPIDFFGQQGASTTSTTTSGGAASASGAQTATQQTISATRQDFLNAGWTDKQIDKAVNAGAIKIQ